jgi:hypothetical protein
VGSIPPAGSGKYKLVAHLGAGELTPKQALATKIQSNEVPIQQRPSAHFSGRTHEAAHLD